MTLIDAEIEFNSISGDVRIKDIRNYTWPCPPPSRAWSLNGRVVEMAFRLFADEPKTLQEIANLCAVSHQFVKTVKDEFCTVQKSKSN
jgi:hypothetical protein